VKGVLLMVKPDEPFGSSLFVVVSNVFSICITEEHCFGLDFSVGTVSVFKFYRAILSFY
jgi:hypothetical protein